MKESKRQKGRGRQEEGRKKEGREEKGRKGTREEGRKGRRRELRQCPLHNGPSGLPSIRRQCFEEIRRY